jgi:serine/threonine protein phosphatase PrpC
MAELVIQVGSCSAQGKRSNNEDAFVADIAGNVFLVADGMGGQEHGEVASGLAREIIPKAVRDSLAAHLDGTEAVRRALTEAHRAILDAGNGDDSCRNMGTTAVLAVAQEDQMWVAGVGDSPAYLVRGGQVEQLTLDHTVADALARSGTLTPEQAKKSPWRNRLYRFLGCRDMTDETDVRLFTPQAGDCLLLASDGLSGYVGDDDLRHGTAGFADARAWADYLVELALQRGSSDNVTCVVVTFG